MILYLPRVVLVCLGVMFYSICGAAEIAGHGNNNQENYGSIAGQIMISGKTPLAGGTIFLFDDSLGPPPSREKYWRIPDSIEDLDKEGKFHFEVPEGRYYFTAIRRNENRDFSPPEDGSLLYFDADSSGNPKVITVIKKKKTDIGFISTAIVFSRKMVRYDKGITAAEGVIIDDKGAPVEGAFIVAFASTDLQPRPLFVSDRTGKDGKFVLRTHDGGNYSLKVRGLYGGGPPATDEFVGSNGPTESHPVTLKKGEKLKGIVLKVKKFPKRGVRYEQAK